MNMPNQFFCRIVCAIFAVAIAFTSSTAFAGDPVSPDGALCVYEYPGDKLISTGCQEDDYTGWFDFGAAGLGAGAGIVVGIVTCCGPIGIAAGVIGAIIAGLFGGGDDVTLCPPDGMQTLTHYFCKLDKVTGQLECEVGFEGNLKPDTVGIQIYSTGTDTTGYVLADMTSSSPVFKLYYSPQRKSSGKLTEIFPDDELISSTGNVTHIFDEANVYNPVTTKRVIRFSFDLDDAKRSNGQSLNFGYSSSSMIFTLTTRGEVIGWGLAYSGVKSYNGTPVKCSAEYDCPNRVGQSFEVNANGPVATGSITAGNQPWSTAFTLTGTNLKVMSTSNPADPELKTPAQSTNGTNNVVSQSKVIAVDNANGGMVTFTFKEPYSVDQINLLNLKTATTVTGFDGADGTGNMLYNFQVPLAGSKPANSLIEFQPNIYGVPAGQRLPKVKSLKVTSGNRFAVTNIFYCPAISCPIGQTPDCAGVCGGTAKPDCLGVCNGTAVPGCDGVCNSMKVKDCKGICGGTTKYDCKGVCGGYAVPGCDGVCDSKKVPGCDGVCGSGKVEDMCWVCGGMNKDKGCDGVCFSNKKYDCKGVCGGTAVYDMCGDCGGNNQAKDCLGVCDGTAVRDNMYQCCIPEAISCGICNGPTPNECGRCDGKGKDICGKCPGAPGYDPNNTDPTICECPQGYDECGVCGGNSKKDICDRCPGQPGYDLGLKDPKLCDCPQGFDECGVCDGPGKDVCGVCGGTATDPSECDEPCDDVDVKSTQFTMDGTAFDQMKLLESVAKATLRQVNASSVSAKKKKVARKQINLAKTTSKALYKSNWEVTWTEITSIQTICPETTQCASVNNGPSISDYQDSSLDFRELISAELSRYKHFLTLNGLKRKRRLQQWSTYNAALHEKAVVASAKIPKTSSKCS